MRKDFADISVSFARFSYADCRYDSLGFPADLTCLVAKQSGWGVDMEGFDAAMQQQRERARLHWTGSGDAQLPADVRCAIRACLFSEKGRRARN